MIELLLQAAYGLNVLILAPVLISLWRARDGQPPHVFEGRAVDSRPLRILVASLWSAILACSVVGLTRPREMIAILLLQVIYKSLWLVFYAWPARRVPPGPPLGVTASFILIVALWPALIWAAWR